MRRILTAAVFALFAIGFIGGCAGSSGSAGGAACACKAGCKCGHCSSGGKGNCGCAK